jgi:hypothetical protein
LFVLHIDDEELHATHLPSFVDMSCLARRHLTDKGVSAAKRILCVLEHERPDVMYSPTLFTLACVLLHYIDEASCYGCIRALVISKQRFIAQTTISHEARVLVLRELARKNAVRISTSLCKLWKLL